MPNAMACHAVLSLSQSECQSPEVPKTQNAIAMQKFRNAKPFPISSRAKQDSDTNRQNNSQ